MSNHSETSTPEERAEEFTSSTMALIDVGLDTPRNAIYELYLQMERLSDVKEKENERLQKAFDELLDMADKYHYRGGEWALHCYVYNIKKEHADE